jgi:hypothetical protein
MLHLKRKISQKFNKKKSLKVDFFSALIWSKLKDQEYFEEIGSR